MARKALGRGLDALIPKDGGGGEGTGPESIVLCDVKKIFSSPLQPRQTFDEKSIKELSESIKAMGVLQPLLVRPRAKGGYELVAGERRLRAARLAGLARAPAIVREMDDRSALELSLVENLQREDLDPLEEAQALQRLLTEFEYTQEELSKRVGKDRSTLANSLRLLNLPEKIKQDLRKGRITPGHARAILMAGTRSLMFSIRDAVVKQGISVREAESMARAASKAGRRSSRKGDVKISGGKDVHIRRMEEQLIRELGTRVKIIKSTKGGHIEIQFYSAEDLDRICKRIIA
jgi:ParB family chromosome partitioning protein